MRQVLPLLFVSFVSGYAGLDLNPRVREYTSEGAEYRELLFKHDDEKVTYVPPLRWNYTATASELRLTPPGNSRASATITVRKLSGDQPLDELAVAGLRQELLDGIPPGGTRAATTSEQQNQLLLGGNVPTYEVVIGYDFAGDKFMRSVLVANRGDTQLKFTLTAPKSEFAAVNAAFRSSLISWQWAPAKLPQTAGGGAASAKVSLE